MSAPAWLDEALGECPKEAEEFQRLSGALQGLPKEAALGTFVGIYEDMLRARDALYEAWITRQMDESEISGA